MPCVKRGTMSCAVRPVGRRRCCGGDSWPSRFDADSVALPADSVQAASARDRSRRGRGEPQHQDDGLIGIGGGEAREIALQPIEFVGEVRRHLSEVCHGAGMQEDG